MRRKKERKKERKKVDITKKKRGVVRNWLECSIPGRVIPKTQKMVLDASLLNIQQYKVGIKGKVEQSRERSSASIVAIEKGAFGSPSTNVANFTL